MQTSNNKFKYQRKMIIHVNEQNYKKLDKISIDYALLENQIPQKS